VTDVLPVHGPARGFRQPVGDLIDGPFAVALFQDPIEELRHLDKALVAPDEPLLFHEPGVFQLADELHPGGKHRLLIARRRRVYRIGKRHLTSFTRPHAGMERPRRRRCTTA